MSICNNCDAPFNAAQEGLLLTAGPAQVAAICRACCQNVRVAKLVVKKPEVGAFVYEQWAPMEMTTSGLSSNQRVG